MFDNGKIQIILSMGPVRIETIGFVDNDYKSTGIIEFDNESSEYKFEIFEKIDDTQTQQIFSGIFIYYYFQNFIDYIKR